MKNTACLVVLFVLTLVMGCQPPGETGSSGPEVPDQIRAKSAPEVNITQIIEELESQVERLENQVQAVQRKPRLDESRTHNFDLTGAPAKGPDDAPLTLVVFSEFECPFCRKFAATGEALLEKFPANLRLVYMNFPLDQQCNSALSRPFHKRACMGANAAMEASKQGKFWEMHDWLFANQRTYSVESIVEFADSQGMDSAAVKEAIETNKYKGVLDDQAKQLLPTGSRGTPTAFINGKKVQNVRWDDVNAASAFIDELANPEKYAEEAKPEPKVAVADPGSLPAAEVVLEDGTLLSDRLKNLSERMVEIKLQQQRPPARQPKKPDPNKVYKINVAGSPTLGPENAPVTIVEFSEFLCPHCASFSQQVKKLREQFPDEIKVVFKGIPNRGHRHSLEAHEAALAAHEQGKFWEMHDKLFENRTKLTPELINQLAENTGLDMEKYKEATTKHLHRKQIIDDLSEADKASVSSTPTVFVNGKVQLDRSLKSVTKAIEKQLKEQKE